MASVYVRTGRDGRPVYYVSYSDLNGKRVRKRIGKSKALAEQAKRDVERRLDEARVGGRSISDVPLGVFAEKYLAHVAQTTSKKTVHSCYRGKVHSFVSFVGSSRRLSTVRPEDIEAFAELRLRDHARATVKTDMAVVGAMLNTAVRWDNLAASPYDRVRRIGRVESKPPDTLSEDEVERLLASSEGTMFHGVIATTLFAGLRMQELVWLEWTDIDFAAFSGQGSITVQNKPGWYTKSRKPRIIPMMPRLRAILARLPRRSRWCFPNVSGGQYLNDLQRDITEVFGRAGLPYGLHALRHTFASRLVAEGVPITYVKELMGHAGIQTTMVYLHATPRHLANAMRSIAFGTDRKEGQAASAG